MNDSCLFGLSDEHLVHVDAHHYLQADVAMAFKNLQSAAAQQGIDCQLVSAYRSFERQLAIWERKWRGEAPLYDSSGRELEHSSLSEWELIQAILTWSALPGASRHHWGTDIDVYDEARVEASGNTFQLVEREYEKNGPCAELADFLVEHAQRYGFAMPYQEFCGGVAREPWHLSYQPSADAMQKQLTATALHAFISQQTLSGKSTILQHFDEIFARFVLNKGIGDNQ